jgi:hypothetical protein
MKFYVVTNGVKYVGKFDGAYAWFVDHIDDAQLFKRHSYAQKVAENTRNHECSVIEVEVTRTIVG